MRLLHCSDLHMRERDLDEIAPILNMIIETARQEQPDVAVIAGDIFDSRDVKLESKTAWTAISFIGALADVCPVAIIIGTPSHDGNAPAILQFVHGAYPVVVAEKPMQVYLMAIASGGHFLAREDIKGYGLDPDAILTLIPQPTKQFFQTAAGISEADQEITARMSALFAGFGASAAEYPGVPHILAYHGSISGAALPSGQVRTGMDIEVSTDQIRMAAGSSRVVGICYGGPIYATKIDEQGPNGFFIHELGAGDFIGCCGHIHQKQWVGVREFLEDGTNRESRFIETPCVRTVRFSKDLTDCLPEETDFLYQNGKPLPLDEIKGVSVRYEIKAWQDEAGEIDKDAIRRDLMENGATDVDIRITRVPRETVRAKSVLAAETLREKIVRVEELRGGTVDPAVLDMADLLEGTPADRLMQMVMGAGEGVRA